MITIPVDEGHAYDFLSILQIKSEIGDDRESKKKLVADTSAHLVAQLGGRHFEIVASKEYAELLEANRETFALVDLAKTDSVKASDVDRSNYRRFLSKKALHEKFFPSSLTEKKTGYEKYE